jgi:hypothetical protein
MHYEREASHVRALAPWDVSLSGGVIPQQRPVDYFGMVQVSFNVGAFMRSANESAYLEARADEVKNARYELVDQLRRFRERTKSVSAQATRELAILEKEAASMTSARELLERADTPQQPQALAIVNLESILAESDRVYLSALVVELARLLEDGHGA